MTFKKSFWIIGIVLGLHALGLAFHLYFTWPWYDIPLHFGGGLAMGALGLALWDSAVSHVVFKGWFSKHLAWWFVPLFVIGFVSFISVVWELHEFALDVLIEGISGFRQPSVPDTMADFFNDLAGGFTAIALFYRPKP